MTLPTRGQALGALGAVALAFVIGRGTQKTITVKEIREVEKTAEKQVQQAKAETAVAKAVADTDRVQWRTKTVYLPGGTVEVTRDVVKEVEKRVVETKVDTVTKLVTQERIIFRDRLHVAALPRWSVGGHVGTGLDLRMRYGCEVSRRLVEGLWFTVGADVPTRALVLGARVEW